MSEVVLKAPVKATVDQVLMDGEWEEGRKFSPGAFAIDYEGEHFAYSCPCGCGSIGRLRIGEKQKPGLSPSWEWDGNRESPTLSPSIHQIGHWHGYLRAGFWTQV